MEKGYQAEILDSTIQQVGHLSQAMCLEDKEKTNDSRQEWGFISDFHSQFRDVEEIIKKHWEILSMDKILKNVLPKEPMFIYRKTSSLETGLLKKFWILHKNQRCFGIGMAFMPAGDVKPANRLILILEDYCLLPRPQTAENLTSNNSYHAILHM